MAFFANGAQETHEERSGGRVHGGFLACLRRVTYSNEFLFLYSSMACFAIGAQVNIHFSQDRVQQRLHPRRERYTMSATKLCSLVSPSFPCASCRRVDPTRRVQRVRLFLCSFVLYMPWIPGEHCRGICAVECATAHLRWFEEDLGSEVVFWIEAPVLACLCRGLSWFRFAGSPALHLRVPAVVVPLDVSFCWPRASRSSSQWEGRRVKRRGTDPRTGPF